MKTYGSDLLLRILYLYGKTNLGFPIVHTTRGYAPSSRARGRGRGARRAARRAPRRALRQRAAELKGSIGEGPNQTNYSDRSSVKILAKFRNFR